MSINSERINEELRFIAMSEIRLTILKELDLRPRNVKQLVKNIKIPYSTITSNLNKLEEKGYIIKNEKKYFLNPLTKLYILDLMEFKTSIDVINNFDKLWYKHDIDQIGEDSLKSITELDKSKLIETTTTDIYKTHNFIKKQMNNSMRVKAIFPYVHPDYPKIIEKILLKQGKIELIINEEIYNGLISEINTKLRRDSIKNENLKIMMTNKPINIYLAICDDNMNLGLFKNDGSYDQNRILTSKNIKSINWAKALFEEIKNEVI